MSRRGYVMIEVIVSIVCVLVLFVPIVRCMDMIRADSIAYSENKRLLKVIEQAKEKIEDAQNESEALQDIALDGYDIDVELDVQVYDNLSKYKVVIKKDGNKKTEFYIYKRY